MHAATAEIEAPLPTKALFERYHVGWETRNAELIASLHAENTIFWLHDGSLPVEGRDALRDHCRTLFATYDFSLQMGRLLYGDDYWIFNWTMVLPLALADGSSFIAHVDMVDVVTVNRAGEVLSKDVYPDLAQMRAAFVKAGIAR